MLYASTVEERLRCNDSMCPVMVRSRSYSSAPSWRTSPCALGQRLLLPGQRDGLQRGHRVFGVASTTPFCMRVVLQRRVGLAGRRQQLTPRV